MLGEAMDMLESVKMRTGNWPDVARLFLVSCQTWWGRTLAWTPSSWSKPIRSFQEEYFEDKNADGNNESTIRNTLNIYLMMTPMRTILKVFLSPWSWLLM